MTKLTFESLPPLRNGDTLSFEYTTGKPTEDRFIESITKRTEKTLSELLSGWEKLYMSNIKVGDRVEAPRHGRGTVLAISGEDAWVQTEGKDYPLTFDIRKLKLVPKPAVGRMVKYLPSISHPGWVAAHQVDAVELTPEVRERLKDLL